ncbi:hypothetical protein K3756_04090 [Sulfitobacter sp. S190]|nr:hypothetical protein K3756_04090 [Sulfitobacter sp. S190]
MLGGLAALALSCAPVLAQDFSENSEAKTWNLYAEVPARFEAQVVDLLCHLADDCPEDCGGGLRQLGLLRSADDTLILPLKNGQPAFSGAAVDLLPYCTQTVEVDGLMIEDPDLGATNVYLVQRIKSGDADWVRANQWTKNWAANHPDAEGKGPWFRRDPRILEMIAKDGYLGLGLETDAEFIADWF